MAPARSDNDSPDNHAVLFSDASSTPMSRSSGADADIWPGLANEDPEMCQLNRRGFAVTPQRVLSRPMNTYETEVRARKKWPVYIFAAGLILLMIALVRPIQYTSESTRVAESQRFVQSRAFTAAAESSPRFTPTARADQCSVRRMVADPDQQWVRPSPVSAWMTLNSSQPARTALSGHPTPSRPTRRAVVSPALDSRNVLTPGFTSVQDRLSHISDFFQPYNNDPDDADELAHPWPWTDGNSEARKKEEEFAAQLWQSRLHGAKQPARLSLFPWDVRFRRFRGRPASTALPASTAPLVPTSSVPGVSQDVRPHETAADLCNRLLAYNPVLFQSLPCPILWVDRSNKPRWNRAAEKGFYNLLKEQQFPSQNLLPGVATRAKDGSVGALTAGVDCTKMKYMVLFALGNSCGLFSRWGGFFRAWRTALAMDPTRIVVWEHRRMSVKHTSEEDYLEEGIVRYFGPISACSNHPYVLDMIRDAHDGNIAHEEPGRFMPHMKHFSRIEEAFAPENQDIQFWRFGFNSAEDAYHSPHRKLLLDFVETPFQSDPDIPAHHAAGQAPEGRAVRVREFHSLASRREDLMKTSIYEHIYRYDIAEQDRHTPANEGDRNFIYHSFVHAMLTAFAFNPTPDIHLMANQLELHWDSILWDRRVEQMRQEALDEMDREHEAKELAFRPHGQVVFDAWDRAEKRIAEILVRGVKRSTYYEYAGETLVKVAPTATTASPVTGQIAATSHSSTSADGLPAPPNCVQEDASDSAVAAVRAQLRLEGASAFHLHPNALASVHPLGGMVIRQGDKAIEDHFYVRHGQFRPLSMFAWKLHDEETRRTREMLRKRRRHFERLLTDADLRHSETEASAAMAAIQNLELTMPRFRFSSVYVITDSVPAFDELLHCASLEPPVVHNSTHYAALLAEAIAAEKAFLDVSLKASRERMQTIREEAKARSARGEKLDKYMLEAGVPFDEDGGIRHLLPGSCQRREIPTCSPLSKFILAGRTIVHNVFAPPACFHPFKRVGFQQFMTSMLYFGRNVEFWVGGMESSLAQVLRTITDYTRQRHDHPLNAGLTNIDPEHDPVFQTYYP